MIPLRRDNLSRRKRRKHNDIGEFEATASSFRQHITQASSSKSYVEDTVSSDRRRVKHIEVPIPPPLPSQQHLDPPLPDCPAADFSSVPDMQWEDNAPVDEESDDDDDELEDDARKARRYASSVRLLMVACLFCTDIISRTSPCVNGCRSAPNIWPSSFEVQDDALPIAVLVLYVEAIHI